jgi:magnesium chelatase subunit D
MRQNFPFSAIVGQDALLKALLVCAINPSIGGVLVRGDKGTAKSTAARALAALLPTIEKVEGCSFNCLPTAPIPHCDPCGESNRLLSEQPAPFVNLPLGATEDRVIGSLDIEKALRSGQRAFQPGLLASAHRGILYIDEVNLLPDHLVDSLLDAAASGTNTIEREGIAISHPASFALVGTMNLEEGDLRPQLLDRFALMVEVEAPSDPEVRAEIVRRRTRFEEGTSAFAQEWEEEQSRWRSAIVQGRRLLPAIRLSDEQLLFISTLCTQLQVRSLRADIVINKTARTLAALDGKTEVDERDIREAAKLALPHRMRTKPGERSSLTDEQMQDLMEQFSSPPQLSEGDESCEQEDGESEVRSAGDQILASAPAAHVRKISVEGAQGVLTSGRRSTMSTTARGAYVRAVKPSAGQEGALAVDATIRSSVLRNQGVLKVEPEDLHIKQRVAKAANTVLFVVDASGSMAALQRMSAVKGAVMGLLADAYKCRDTVGVIAFKGDSAQLVLPPTRSTDVAASKLDALPTGGRTPLASALQLALTVTSAPACQSAPPLLVLLTDGKANVGLDAGSDPWQDVLSNAERLKDAGVASIVVDTEAGFVLFGQARNVAEAMGAEYVKLDDLTSETLKLEVKSRLSMRKP